MIYGSQILSQPDARFPSCHAASLAVLPDGTLAVVYFAGSYEGSSDSANLLQRLLPNGTWSDPQLVQYEPGKSAGNAVLFPLPDGRTILFYTLSYTTGKKVFWDNALIHYRFSEDNGLTWGKQETLFDEFGFICRQPGLVLPNGSWLLPIYDNRGGDSVRYPGWGGNEGAVAISDDGGRHWTRYGRMTRDAGLAQPCVIQLGGGHLKAWLRTRNLWNGSNSEWACLYTSESSDNGHNWSLPERTTLPNNNSSFQIIRLNKGVLLLVYNHQRSPLRSPLNTALSFDGGISWCCQQELEPFDAEGGEYSYPAAAMAADGIIHIAYTFRRQYIKHVFCDMDWLTAENAPVARRR